MNGDYVELVGPTSETELVSTLTDVLGPMVARLESSSYTKLTLNDESFVFVDFHPGSSWDALLAIGRPDGDDSVRHSSAKRIYDALAADTSWMLRWTSDASSEVCEVAGRRRIRSA